VGYHFSEAQVQNWHIEDDGVLNITHTALGADNAVSLTIVDGSTAFTTGYLQGYYVSLTTSSAASYTTGNSQINGIAVDLTLGGTIGCEASGMYIYVAGGSSPSMASAQVTGLNIYIDDLGSNTPAVKSCITLHMADNSTASGGVYRDAFIFFKSEAGAVTKSLLGCMAASNAEPSYFLSTNFTGNKMIGAITISTGSQDKVLLVNLNGSTYWIPMYAASA